MPERQQKKKKPRVDPDAVETESAVERIARVSLALIERKLKGVHAGYIRPDSKDPLPTKEISVGNQVEALIQVRLYPLPACRTSPHEPSLLNPLQEATNASNLGRMYIG